MFTWEKIDGECVGLVKVVVVGHLDSFHSILVDFELEEDVALVKTLHHYFFHRD